MTGQPGFAELFVLAVGNHVLSCAIHVASEVDEALRRERWLDGRLSAGLGIEGCFSQALTCVISGDGFIDARGGWLAKGAARAVLDAMTGQTGSLLDAGPVAWVKQRIGSADPANPATVALGRFLRSGERSVADLPPLLDAVA
jgi:hypothetical protein